MNPVKRTRFHDKTMVYASRKFMATFRTDGDVLTVLRRNTCGELRSTVQVSSIVISRPFNCLNLSYKGVNLAIAKR